MVSIGVLFVAIVCDTFDVDSSQRTGGPAL
jgi:hypothetical protein